MGGVIPYSSYFLFLFFLTWFSLYASFVPIKKIILLHTKHGFEENQTIIPFRIDRFDCLIILQTIHFDTNTGDIWITM